MSSQDSPKQDWEGTYRTVEGFVDLIVDPFLARGIEKNFLLPETYLSEIIKSIEGMVLTIIDSSLSDKQQREATKSIVRQMIWKNVERIRLVRLEKIE